MRWYKHDSDAHSDAKIEKLMAKYGLEGYGLYFYCLELIAKDLTGESFTFELEHDAQVLARRLYMSQEIIEEMMTFMVNLGLFENKDGKITCLKLAYRLDQSMTNSPKLRQAIQGVRTGHDNVMTLSGDVMKDKTRQDKTIDRAKTRFSPPTLEELETYFCEKGSNASEANKFFLFYSSKGWHVGKNKMKSWPHAASLWISRNKTEDNNVPVQNYI